MPNGPDLIQRASGPPARAGAGTLAELFLKGIESPREIAYQRRRADGTWESVSTEEMARRVHSLAAGLVDLGLERGDRIAIMSHTRLEWAIADYASILCGLVTVPVYPNLPPEQVGFILRDARVDAAFVADDEQRAKLDDETRGRLRAIIQFDPPARGAGDLVHALDGMLERVVSAPDREEIVRTARQTRPEELATLIYTSGTTGRPKGVMLTHANFYSNAVETCRVFPISPADTALSLLPLAHVFERTVGHYIMFHAGVTIAYADSPQTVARDLGEVRPTVMAAVPRVFEKILERVEAAAREGGRLKWKLFRWARRVGEHKAELELAGDSVPLPVRLQAAVADRLVFSKLRARTGGRIRYFVSGGAPLPPAVARFFFAAGLPVVEGYGLTETSPVLAFNPVDAIRIGTVGPPIPGTELAIAEDGEILARGPQIMAGYLGLDEATSEVIDTDGWFHTGDIGTLSDDGYLSITDRKKELIVTAYGKNIAPAPIESALKADALVSEAVMLGDRQKFPIVLVVPEPEKLKELARASGVAGGDAAALLEDAGLRAEASRRVLALASGFARYEQPRHVLWIPEPFSIDGGELTPKLSVKRRVVMEKYADRIAAAFDEAEREYEERAADADSDAGP